MGERSVRVRRGLGLMVTALGVTLAFAACNATLESRCYDGPCNEQDDITTTTAAECHPSKNGSDTCSDDPQDGDFPCDVSKVLEEKCQTCHTDPHLNGAPIDLLTCNRFHEMDCGPSRTRFRTADFYLFCTNFMPLGKQLTDAERQTLKDWIGACAPCVPKGTGCSGTASAKTCYQD